MSIKATAVDFQWKIDSEKRRGRNLLGFSCLDTRNSSIEISLNVFPCVEVSWSGLYLTYCIENKGNFFKQRMIWCEKLVVNHFPTSFCVTEVSFFFLGSPIRFIINLCPKKWFLGTPSGCLLKIRKVFLLRIVRIYFVKRREVV